MTPQQPGDDSSDGEGPLKQQQVAVHRGGGKFAAMQQRAAAAGAGGNDSDSSDSSDDDDLPIVQRPVVGGGKSLGKQLGRGGGGGGGGKNILALQRPPSDDSDDDSSDDDAPVPQYGGKSLGKQLNRGGGKQLRMPAMADSDSSDDSDDDAMDIDDTPAPAAAPAAAPARRGGGKQPRKPAPADDDMEESSEDDDDDEEEAIGDAEVDDDDEEEDDDLDEDIEELDMETFDTTRLIKDEADRKRLEKMPEFEREAELADRFEKLKNELDMKRALQQDKRRVREEKEQAKKAAAAAAAAAGKGKGKKGAAAKGKATRASARSTTKAKAKTKKQKAQEEADAALAASMSTTRESSKRNKDASGSKGKKAAALKSLREERSIAKQKAAADESDSDLDYGDDGASDSESDYEDEGGAVNKPWLQKKQTTRKTRLQRDVSSESESDLDDDAMMMDDDEDGNKRSAGGRLSQQQQSATFVEADSADYVKVTIPRRRLSRWCHEPFFEDAVTNMYVKLAVGKDSQKLKSCYRLCQIVGVETRPAEYTFPPEKNSDKKPVSTNKVLKLKFGNSIRAFRMALISDSKPQEDDVKALVSHLRDNRLNDEILSKKRAIKLRRLQDKLVNNYTYTREDIEKSIAAKKKRKVGNIGAEKTRAAIAVQAAQEDVNDAEAKLDEAKRALLEADENDMGVEQLESAVTLATEALEDAKSALEEKKLEQERILTAEEIRKKRIKGADKIQDWNKVNERAMEKNKMADYEAYKQQREQEKKEAAAQGAPKFNPYARRKVKPKILWEVGQKTDEDDKDKAAAAEDAAGSAGAAGQVSADGQKGTDAAASSGDAANVPGKENASADDRKNNDDFAIDDELLIRGGSDSLAAAATGGSVAGRAGVRVRKGLSFADYQKAKEVGHL